jgi:hypothetical protein
MLDTNLVKIPELPPIHKGSVNTTQTSLVAQHHIKSHGPLLKIPLLLQLNTAAAAAMQTTVSQ